MTEAGVGRGHPRAPEGPLLPDPPRRRLLAGADARPARRSRRRSSTRRRRRACSATPARPTTARPRAASPPSPRSARWSCSRYGVRSNAIAPAARTRLTEQTPGPQRGREGARGRRQFDVWDPANVSPFVAYLATEDCPFTRRGVPRPGRRRPALRSRGRCRRRSTRATAGPSPSWPPRPPSSPPKK